MTSTKHAVEKVLGKYGEGMSFDVDDALWWRVLVFSPVTVLAWSTFFI